MKKKNNPFKMWGSWIGLVIGLILMSTLIQSGFYCPIHIDPNSNICDYENGGVNTICLGLKLPSGDLSHTKCLLPKIETNNFTTLIGYRIIYLISFFLIGWGINVWWRKR